MMTSEEQQSGTSLITANSFRSAEVVEILVEHRWVDAAAALSAEHLAWCERAAAMLGPHVADRAALAELLSLVFHYDAQELFSRVETHVVLSRYAARDVLRQLALALLDGAPLTSDRFSEIITELKGVLDVSLRELFYPIRLCLAGREGEGELDRVILLIDSAAALPFAVPVKSNHARILEFCSSLD